jgi:hypothetical protein
MPNVKCVAIACLFTVLFGYATTGAEAGCNVTTATITSVNSASIGTYSAPVALGPVTVSVTFTYTTSGGGGSGCHGGAAFSRPAGTSGALNNGSATIPYTLFGSTSGVSPLYTGATPTSTQYEPFVLAAGSTGSATVTFILQGSPSTTALSGSYADNLTLNIFDVKGTNIQGGAIGSSNFTIMGAVSSSCVVVNGTLQNANQTIGVGVLGQTTGMATGAPSFNVTCSAPSTVALSSTNGAVTRGGVLKSSLVAVPNFRNKIEYFATLNGGAGSVTLNTATGNTVNGVFNATSIASRATIVTITPEASIVPLVAGSYSDILRIIVTPN